MRELKLLPPKPGIRYTMDDIMITNKPEQQPPFEYILFMNRIIGKRSQRFIHVITEATRKQANKELTKIAEREDVAIVKEKTHEVLPKDWL